MQRRDDQYIETVAIRLKALRIKAGKSQRDVYIDTDINIGKLEVGKTNISISTLSILCKYYGIKLEEFHKGL